MGDVFVTCESKTKPKFARRKVKLSILVCKSWEIVNRCEREREQDEDFIELFVSIFYGYIVLIWFSICFSLPLSYVLVRGFIYLCVNTRTGRDGWENGQFIILAASTIQLHQFNCRIGNNWNSIRVASRWLRFGTFIIDCGGRNHRLFADINGISNFVRSIHLWIYLKPFRRDNIKLFQVFCKGCTDTR